MKALRALLLVLALSVCAFADGNIPCDRDGNISIDRTGIMPNGRAGEMPNDKAGEIPNGKDGWMETGKTGDIPNDLVTATALQLLQSIMPLF